MSVAAAARMESEAKMRAVLDSPERVETRLGFIRATAL
jgi:hypothetical protein